MGSDLSWEVDVREASAVTEARHRFVDSLRCVAEPEADLVGPAIAFTELLANVHRHTPGRARISMRSCAGGSVTLTVADRGPSFTPPREVPDDVFRTDQRGLVIVERLVGPISVDRSPFGWNIVTVTLPLAHVVPACHG